LRLFERLRVLTGGLIKPVREGWRRLPRLWALITGKKAGGLALYRQDFSGLDLRDLLYAVSRELPGGKKGKKGRAGKEGKVVKRAYHLPPGTVRVSGSFLWAGEKRET
jgi:hypothetical protein